MKRIITIVVVIIIIGLLAWPKLFGDKKGQAGAGPKGPGGPVPVQVRVAEPATLENKMVIGGSLRSNEEIDLMAEVAGKITGIHFKEGEVVKKGQLLVKINDDELRASLRRLEAGRKLAKDNETRLKSLLSKGGISQQEYETAATEVNSLDEEMNRVEAQIGKTSIIAPFPGRVGLRSVSEGSFVAPNTKIASLVNDDPVKLDFSVPEKFASAIVPGQQVKFFMHGLDSPFVATVYAKEPRIDEATRTLSVRAESPNKDGKLLPGSFARVEMAFKPTPGSVTVPAEAIVPVLKGQKVYIVKNGAAVEKMVETGIRNETVVEITSGVSAGDSVVVSGILGLKPGAKVMPIREAAKKK